MSDLGLDTVSAGQASAEYIFFFIFGSIREDDFQSPGFTDITEATDSSEAIVDYGWWSGLAG